jgi:hypothetical protein
VLWRVFFLICFLFWRTAFVFNLVSFSGNPLYHKSSIVLAEEVVIEGLLCEESTDEIFEGNQGVLFIIKDLNLFQFSKHSKDLMGLNKNTYIF